MKFRSSVNSVLAVCSAVWLYTANMAYRFVRINSYVDNATGDMYNNQLSYNDARWNTVVAGASMLFICNIFAMVLVDVVAADAESADVPAVTAAKGGVTATPTPV